jgi:hypothetical protein
MGRVMRHRHRVRAELSSVRTKDTRGLICRTLTSEFGANKIEAEVLSSRSLEWLGQMGVSALPGVVRLSVPEGSSKRYSRTRRKVVSVSAVDVGADSACWEAFGLEVAQRMRLVRWIEQIARQGACASLAELASWANLTPTAAQARLSPLRRLGIYLPHVGGPEDSDDALSTEALLVDRYLTNGATEDLRHLLGVTAPAFEATLRRFITVTEGQAVGLSIEELARTCDRSEAEIAKLASVAHRHRRSAALRELRAAYGGVVGASADPASEKAICAELVSRFGFSALSAQVFDDWLSELARTIDPGRTDDGELVFFAISADEGARARLAEAAQVPVRLSFFTEDDANLSCYAPARTKVSELKFSRICRFATEARAQGALLTLPDLALLMGISVDAVRHAIASNPQIVVPTRGRVRDIGRGVSHKAQIVELYLQCHTETEITELTGHSYASVEAYLSEFARVVTLADQGLNTVMIRRVTGRSMALIEAYLALYRRYDSAEYHFRLAGLRRVFVREEVLAQKGGPTGRRRGPR